jgi:hypothetical protein
MGMDPEREPPFFFSKPADAVVPNGTPVSYPPRTSNLHHEIELVVAIGTGGRDIPLADALAHVFGYAVGNDLTRRDLQFEAREQRRPWDVAKGFDCSAPVSAIRPAAEIGHRERGAIWLEVNGEARQRADLSEMIWSVPEIVAELSTPPPNRRKLALGIDHGTQARTETAVLVQVDESQEYPAVHVLDCIEGGESQSIEEDAANIIAMLARNGLTWADLDHVMGDIPHYGGSRLVKKSNQDLAYEIMRQLYPTRSRAGLSLTPPIRTAKAGKGSGPRGSAMRGTSWLHHSMSRRGQFAVHPDAIRVAECIERYVGGSTDPAGHLIDALRYALDPWIRRGQTRYASR